VSLGLLLLLLALSFHSLIPPPLFIHSGTDTFNDIKKGKWKRGRELLELVSVVVVSRPGVPYAIHEEDLVNPRCVTKVFFFADNK
jgi:nicotinic acid mononucleotide adenylyltransferase